MIRDWSMNTTSASASAGEFTADKGFFLNGEHFYLWGFNAHEDRAGWAFLP